MCGRGDGTLLVAGQIRKKMTDYGKFSHRIFLDNQSADKDTETC